MGVEERVWFEAADQTTDNLGCVGVRIPPENCAREEARCERLKSPGIERVRVRDREKQGVDAPQGGHMFLC